MKDFREERPKPGISIQLLAAAREDGRAAGKTGSMPFVPAGWGRCEDAWLKGWDEGRAAYCRRYKKAQAFVFDFNRGK